MSILISPSTAASICSTWPLGWVWPGATVETVAAMLMLSLALSPS